MFEQFNYFVLAASIETRDFKMIDNDHFKLNTFVECLLASCIPAVSWIRKKTLSRKSLVSVRTTMMIQACT
jgi:hypothetical protein